MTLELEAKELNDLQEVLSTSIQGLYGELARTDRRDYRERLREKLRRFEAMSARLEQPKALRDAVM